MSGRRGRPAESAESAISEMKAPTVLLLGAATERRAPLGTTSRGICIVNEAKLTQIRAPVAVVPCAQVGAAGHCRSRTANSGDTSVAVILRHSLATYASTVSSALWNSIVVFSYSFRSFVSTVLRSTPTR